MNTIRALLDALEKDECSALLPIENVGFCQLYCLDFNGPFYALTINGRQSNSSKHKSRMKKILMEWGDGKRKVNCGILMVN